MTIWYAADIVDIYNHKGLFKYENLFLIVQKG